MTDPDGPDVARLAALDAGLLDAHDAAAVRAAAAADPAVQTVLDALAATRAELAAQPTERMPADVVAGIRAALDRVDGGRSRPDPGNAHGDPDTRRSRPDPAGAHRNADPGRSRRGPGHTNGVSARSHGRTREPGGGSDGPAGIPGPPTMAPRGPEPRGAGQGGDAGPHAGRSRPGRRVPGRRAVLAAAAALSAVIGAGALLAHAPGVGSHSPVLALRTGELAAAGASAIGAADLGDLADPARRAGCLREIAVPAPEGTVLGGRRVLLDGRPGVLLVLPTGILGTFRLIVVDPDCGPDGGILLTDELVPR
ncbi:hypothetical protein ACVGVM_27620 [Pseudonocardia bannensis]|uniref:Anti-sigma-M factor RsmA n=1 Tax=Pseudonocardia bannensis TaxID=630973 RepID=A0A848DG69_9PSEU|nr:hypothetical protein [Pseudonocardia bannensis]NMH91533.1 hypothetical protein [Pseudonocardia bannensis]